jgi:hypothetical protein
MSKKFCKSCGVELPKENFYRNAWRDDGLQFYCKPHQDEFVKESKERKANPVDPERYRGILASIVQQYRSGA